MEQYCRLIVTPERRSEQRLREEQERGHADRRILPRYHLDGNNPYGFSSLIDPALLNFADSVCSFQNESILQHPDRARDMSPLSLHQCTRAALEGNVHAFFQEQTCIACFLIELLGDHSGHLVTKGGYLAVESSREVYEFADTLLLPGFQGMWVVMRTWNGLRQLLHRLLRGKKAFGPWLEYSYVEFQKCLKQVAYLYLRKPSLTRDSADEMKEDNGNIFLVRPPVGTVLTEQMLPSSLSTETQSWLQERTTRQLSVVERGLIVQYYAKIERAGRLGGYSVPDIRRLTYGECL